jgi:4,5-DOPA dioxygenase extradiol
MPALFIGHGSPMNSVETNRWTTSWSDVALSMPKPRAIVAISAHWFINATAVTSMARPRVINDFFGFPQELFDFDYAAPGSPDLARQLADIVAPTWVGLDDETWGIDHGTWSVLAHMYPDADVPVVQLAIAASKDMQYHLDLGAQLAPLMDDDVLILGSGNVVHNLRALSWGAKDQGFDWAQRFDNDARSLLRSAPEQLGSLVDSDDYRFAVPTMDHFLPLAYIAGIAAATGGAVSTFAEGCTLGSLSMTSYAVAPARG